MKRFAAALLLPITLAACSSRPPIKVGTVVAHKFVPAHTDYIPGVNIPGHEDCFSTGKSEECDYVPGVYTPPQWIHHDDEWRVELQDPNSTRKSWRTVSEAVYNDCPINSRCDTA